MQFFLFYMNCCRGVTTAVKIARIINNNVISSTDDRGKEVVVMGKGIGFQKKAGDEVASEKIEKIFSLPEESRNQFETLLKDMPYEHMQLAEEIIHYATEALGKKLNKNIYITLTDHLNYAIERKKQGVELQNAFLWEIQKFYQKEYQIGLHALAIVKERIGVELSVDEAGFLALHVVNAEMDADLKQSVTMPGVIKDILNIIKYTMGKDLDENSLSYERLVTHLKFFLQRVIKKEAYPNKSDIMCQTIREHCPDEWGCACKIRDYINNKFSHETSEEELMYLTVHINRVTRTEENA